MPVLVAVADYNIAYLYYLRGEYTRSIELYRAAREDCRTLGDAYREALCDLDQSEMYLELNLIEEGAHLAGRAQKAFLELGMGYEAAKAQTNLAISLTHHGDTAVALELFHRGAPALRSRKQSRLDRHHRSLPGPGLLPGSPPRRSAGACASGRSISSGLRPCSPRACSASCCWPASIWIAARAQQAKQVCLAALDRLQQAETPALSYQAWYVLGVIEEALGDPEAAYQAYLKAHHHLENLRSHLKAEEMKIAFLKDKLEVYEALVRMCLGAGPLAGHPGDRLRLHRAGQIAQPGRPDRLPFPGTARLAEDRTRPGGPGQHAARRTELVQPHDPAAGRPRRQPDGAATGQTAPRRPRLRAAPGGSPGQPAGGRRGVRQPADGGFGAHRDHSRFPAGGRPAAGVLLRPRHGSMPACCPATA